MRNFIHKAEHFGLSLFVATGLGGFAALAHGYNNGGNLSYTPKSVIQQAQDELRDEGYYSGRINGMMGWQTQRSLREFQRVNNLNVTGRLDPETIRTLGVTPEEGFAGEASRSAEEPYLSTSTLRQAQQQLKSSGAYAGTIDGKVGPETRDAVRQYQRQNNLQATGMLDRATLRSMGLSQSSANQYNSNSNEPNTNQPNSNQYNSNRQ